MMSECKFCGEMRDNPCTRSGSPAECRYTHSLIKGDALDLILELQERPTIIVTDPPYALRGDGDEHAISATVAIVLREAAKKLAPGGWMLIMCASSWRSQAYMVESVRGLVEPVRTLTWCKPAARTKARTSGPSFASVQVLAFKKGKSAVEPADLLDHITAPPLTVGRRRSCPRKWLTGWFAPMAGRATCCWTPLLAPEPSSMRRSGLA